MAITSQDVKLFKAEVMADTAAGGGRMTGNEVVDDELNNVFDDTSRDDRVNGRVSLRKVFGAVVTPNTDKYLGAHAIVTDPPDDGRVVVTIVHRNDHADRRAAVQEQVEQYLTQAQVSTLTLWDTQPEGSRTLIAYQEATLAMPEVSDVLCLSVELTSHAQYGHQQFLRITSISSQITPYTNLVSGAAAGKNCRIMTIEVSDKLEIDYPGGDIREYPTLSDRPTRVRLTTFAADARYYGIVPLAADVTAGDVSLSVETILQPIVPATYSETPLLDQQLGGTGNPLVESGPPLTMSFAVTASGGAFSIQLPIAIAPGSVTLVADAPSADDDVTLTDAGGVLTRTSGGVNTTAATGTAGYTAGLLTVFGVPNVAYSVSVTFTPATAIPGVQFTAGILIEEDNRGFNYNRTLGPLPSAGSVVAQYRALGRWYTLTDDGAGVLRGDVGTGTGTINYLTGTANVTTGYEPDVGSYVLFGWGSGTSYQQQTDPAALSLGAINGGFVLAAGLVAGSVTATWTVDTTNYTATDDGDGNFIGDGSGTLDYTAGEVHFVPDVMPAAQTEIHFDYEAHGELITEVPTPSIDGSTVSFTVTTAPIAANSTTVRAMYADDDGGSHEIVFYQTGSMFAMDGQATGSGVRAASSVGSVSNATGNVVLPRVMVDAYTHWYTTYDAWGPYMTEEQQDLTFSSLIDVSYAEDTAGTPDGQDIVLTSLGVDYTRTVSEGLVARSLMWRLNGRSYYDRGGVLYYRDGSGLEIAAGTVDYISGEGLITDWVAGPYSVSFDSALTVLGAWELQRMIWRTAGSPLRSQSFQLTNGVQTVASAEDGTLQGAAEITGTIDHQSGVYDVTFNPPVAPELARYNAVALTYLPLDAELLGLNPVRLPLDGRVPVIDSGRMLVLLHTQTTVLPNPVIAGQTYALPRGALAYAVVRDADGLKLPTDRYTADLDVGSITFANPLDLTAYAEPLQVEHRIEDMCLCTDAQLNGQLTVASSDPVLPAISHDYQAGESYVASAMRYGDLQAAVSVPFDQQAWTGVWSDEPIGSDATGEFNVVAYPITVTNAGAITERWRIEFTGSAVFRLIGETTGQVATGGTDVDFAPINPATGQPYFTVPALGWGAGWAGGNQLRFNTTACAAAIWLLRCTLQGPAEEPNDSFRLQFRGDN